MKNIVSLRIAKLLKDNKWNNIDEYYYKNDDIIPHKFIKISKNSKSSVFFDYITAPYYHDVLRWFRENHNIHIEIKPIFYSAVNIPYSSVIFKDIHKETFKYKILSAEENYELMLEKTIYTALLEFF